MPIIRRRLFIGLALLSPFFSISQNQELILFKKKEDLLRQHIINGDKKEVDSLFKDIKITIWSDKKDSLNAILNNLRGIYFFNISMPDEAMINWLKSLNYYENVDDSLNISKVYSNMTAALNETGQYEKSIAMTKKALKYCPESSPDKEWPIDLLNNLGIHYNLREKLDSSFYYLKRALKEAKKIDYKLGSGCSYNAMAENYLNLKDYGSVISYCDTVQQLYAKDVTPSMLENSFYYSSVAFFNEGKYTEALKKAQKSLNLLLKNGMLNNASETYAHISDIHHKMGDNTSALENMKKSIVFKDSINNMQTIKSILELEKKYETEKKEKLNLKLKQEASIKDLTIVRKNNYILFGSLVFLTIILSLIIYQLRKFKNKNTALENAIIKREKVERELKIVRDNIAKDFHDDLGNKLARITVLSDYMIQSGKKKNKIQIIDALKKIKLDSDILYKGTRDFMFSLKVSSDYVEELFTYLSDFGEDFFRSFDIDFYVEKEINTNLKLPYYWNRQIIMIFKEAMTNAAKHSKATEVKLSMILIEKKLSLTFKDNGFGFTMDAVSKKNGLSNMVVRAKKIGVELKIISSDGGTEIKFITKLTD